MKYKIGIKSKHTGITDWIVDFQGNIQTWDSMQEANQQVIYLKATGSLGNHPHYPVNFDYVIEPMEIKLDIHS